ncbi:5855_t:CDS:1, partial [Gigaspora margarita]
DPNKDFKILDDINIGDISKSFKQQTTTVPSSYTCSTSNIENNV